MMKTCSLITMEDEILKALLDDDGRQQNMAEAGELPEAETSSAEDSCPLTQTQLGVYYDCVKHPEAMTYNIPSATYFPASVSAETLKEAVGIVVKAHPYLNVRIRDEGGRLVQARRKGDSYQFLIHDGRGVRGICERLCKAVCHYP